MSLFEEAKKAKNPFGERAKTQSKDNENPMINQTSLLLRVLNEVFDEQKLSEDNAANCEGYRTRLGDTSWPLHNLQGKVTEPTWANMLNATIAGMAKTIRNSQPNGEWKMLNYETKIDHDADKIERVYLVIKFVDVDNSEDLSYRNGVPVTTTVNVQTNPVPQEVLDALTNRQTDDSRLAGMIEQLVTALVDKSNTTATVQTDAVTGDPEPEPVVFND
mgnify:FL=1|tara:strand:+ start:134 stop:787 length:654 start_codon:yes stop_codon:yes gene_type:complete